MLGAFVGDVADCSRRLVERVETHLKPLEKMCRLRDTKREKCAMQVQLEINRFCGNTSLTYFIRGMGLAATRAAAARHDALIEQASSPCSASINHVSVAVHKAVANQGAERRARLLRRR